MSGDPIDLDAIEAPTYRLVPYRCEPGCCAPAGWVGRECFICDDGVIYGGTVEAITQSAEEHAEQIHQRSKWLALVAEVRRLRAEVETWQQLAAEWEDIARKGWE